MPAQSLKIDNARYVITVDRERRIIQDGSILVEDGKVSRVGKAAALANAGADRVIDARTAVIGTGAGAARLVLLTCYPFDALRPGGPLRYAVVSVPGTSGGASRRTP